MNKKVVIGIVVVIVIIVGWMMFGRGGALPGGSVSGVFNGSLADLVKRGGNYKCDYAFDSESGKMTGTAYVSGQKMRTDATMEIKQMAGQKVESHTINDGQFIYTWSSMMPQGYKMAATAGDQPAAGDVAAQGQVNNNNQKMDFNCAAWTVDAALLTPPANISFQSL